MGLRCGPAVVEVVVGVGDTLGWAVKDWWYKTTQPLDYWARAYRTVAHGESPKGFLEGEDPDGETEEAAFDAATDAEHKDGEVSRDYVKLIFWLLLAGGGAFAAYRLGVLAAQTAAVALPYAVQNAGGVATLARVARGV